MLWIRFAVGNFFVPIAFFAAYHTLGARAAIGFAVGAVIIQAVLLRATRTKASPFFITAAFFTLLFGGADLLISDPRFYRFEPFAQNFVIGSVVLGSLFFKGSLLEVFANALPQPIRPAAGSIPSKYLRKLTAVWAGYFYAKAVFYLWLAQAVNLGSLMLIRALVGQVSFLTLIIVEIVLRKRAGRRGSPGS
jgi:intracellular septation protein A